MKTKPIFIALLLAVGGMTAMAKSHQVKSSDGQLIVTITDDGGKPAYEVSFQRSSCTAYFQ